MLHIWTTPTVEPKAFTLSIGFGEDSNCVARLRYLDKLPRFPRTEKIEVMAKTPEAAVALLNVRFLKLLVERGEIEEEISITRANELDNVDYVADTGIEDDNEIPF